MILKNYFEDFKIDRSIIFMCDKCQFIEKSSINRYCNQNSKSYK